MSVISATPPTAHRSRREIIYSRLRTTTRRLVHPFVMVLGWPSAATVYRKRRIAEAILLGTLLTALLYVAMLLLTVMAPPPPIEVTLGSLSDTSGQTAAAPLDTRSLPMLPPAIATASLQASPIATISPLLMVTPVASLTNTQLLTTAADFEIKTSITAADSVTARPADSAIARRESGETASSGKFDWPLHGVLTQSFSTTHNGLDIAAAYGSPIYAADGGTVTFSGWNEHGLGYAVFIQHSAGYLTIYGHMSTPPSLSVGEAIAKGQQIGSVGASGIATGPHCHFMVVLNDTPINPLSVLPNQ